MLTIRQAWIGLLILFLVALLVVVAATYWQYITGASAAHLLAFIPQPGAGQGC